MDPGKGATQTRFLKILLRIPLRIGKPSKNTFHLVRFYDEIRNPIHYDQKIKEWKLQNPIKNQPRNQKDFVKREQLFWDLTLKLEAFTHTVPVPFAVYYAVITQKMEESHWRIFIALCVVFATGIGLFGTFIRHLLIKYLYAKIERIESPSDPTKLSTEEKDYAKSVKLLLFRYPLVEAWIIVIRWLFGVVPILSLYTYIVEYTPSVIRSGIFTMIMIPPISFVTYYFITENTIRPLFDLPQIRNIEIKPNEIPKFDYFKRILVAFFSLAALPVSVLSYILYSVAKGETAVEEPLIPIVIVASIFIVPLIVCSYVVAKTVKQGLNETSRSLDELAKGNFDVTVMPKSSDDFAQQAFYLNSIIQKLKDMYGEIKSLNEGLEEKVQIRTEELNRSLQEVQALKSQQDADYYLTFQLLSPLAHHTNHSSNFEVKHFLKQKKNFEFRKMEYEIGGDINISHSIELQGKKYLLFVNADAMGKSMQGAGGALVFGAVFQSIVQRTKSNKIFRENSPEEWLSSSLEEMHRIFETFDGTMLVSLTMGLIEEKTGTLHFLNAEHPWMVLLRDGKANFLYADVSYRKLGTLGATSAKHIKVTELKPHDLLIVGSDGKDDILIPNGEGDWEINSDDELFLRLVEKHSGDLEAIVQEIQTIGQVIDDISMIRIKRKEPVSQTLERFQISETIA